MRYFLIDKIELIEVYRKIIAKKNVTLSEDIFTDHFLGYPVMPGALLIECLAQAGTALLEYSCDFEKKAILVMISKAKFRKIVTPGDQLTIIGELKSYDQESAILEGIITVKNQHVMEGDLIFAYSDKNIYYPEKIWPLIEVVYDIWLKNTKIIRDDSKRN